MADSPNNTILSRRDALTAAVGAALVLASSTSAQTAPAAWNSETDRWLARWYRYVEAEDKHSAAVNEAEIAAMMAKEAYPRKRLLLSTTAGVFNGSKMESI